MNWRTATGLQFFEDYILPTTSRTKNPLYRAIGIADAMQKVVGVENSIESLQRRIRNAMLYGGIHVVGEVISITALVRNIAEENVPGAIVSGLATALNGYATALQIEISLRVKKVLAHRQKRSTNV